MAIVCACMRSMMVACTSLRLEMAHMSITSVETFHGIVKFPVVRLIRQGGEKNLP
jgi:hypothetical protein